MRLFSKGLIREFWRIHPQAEEPLRTWWDRTTDAKWRSFAEVRNDYPTADFVKASNGDKLVFNIGGNKFRLICLVEFGKDSMFLLWVGTHAEYDRLDIKSL